MPELRVNVSNAAYVRPCAHPMINIDIPVHDAKSAVFRPQPGMGMLVVSVPKIDTGGERQLFSPPGLLWGFDISGRF